MLWVYAQLCSYHLATGRNERRRRRRGGGYRSRSTRFEKKINARTSNLLFRFPTALTRLKKNRERFDRCKNRASKEEEVSRTRSRPSLSVCLFHIAHILPERDYSSRGQKFRAPPLNRHPRDILLDAITILAKLDARDN